MATTTGVGYIRRMDKDMIRRGRKLTLKVCKDKSGWRVQACETEFVVFRTKVEAMAAARDCLARKGGQVWVHAGDGRVACVTVMGAEAARRLNAIEGVTPDQASRRLIRQVAGKTLKQRRQAVLEHFRKVASV